MIIAQRFIAGNAMVGNSLSPGGTAEACLSVQSSLRDYISIRRHYPSDKSLGYFQSPLRGGSVYVGNNKLLSSAS